MAALAGDRFSVTFAKECVMVGRRTVVSSALVLVVPALLVGQLMGMMFGGSPAPTDPADADAEAVVATEAAVATDAESSSAYVRFRAFRRRRMHGPRFWLAFGIAFIVVEAAGVAYMMKHPSRDEDARLKSMTAVVKKRL
jgi:hypothetical protein